MYVFSITVFEVNQLCLCGVIKEILNLIFFLIKTAKQGFLEV